MYMLSLRFTSGQKQDIMLEKPHQLTPDTLRPHALVYEDDAGMVHNIPFSSLDEFYFDPKMYNQCGASDCPIHGKKQ